MNKSLVNALVATLSVIAVLGATILGASMKWGIGLSPDSVVYVSGARGLLGGSGFSLPSYSGDFIPVVQYPPLFPIGLALLGLAGLDPLEGAKWFNLVLFAANVTLIGWTVYFSTRSFGSSVLISLLAMVSFPMVQVHSMAWSEPLFIFCTFLGLALLAHYTEAHQRSLLIASSLLVGLGFLTRYAGVATVFTGISGILLFCRAPLRKRLFDTIVFCFLSCSLAGLWMVRNLAVAKDITGRPIGFHAPTWEHLGSAVKTIVFWLLPVGIYPSGMLLVVCITLTLAVLLMTRRIKEAKVLQIHTALPRLLLLFVVNYGLLLLVTVSFLDAQTPFDNRVLSPAFLGVLVLVVCLSADLLRVSKSAVLARITLSAALFLFLLSHSERSAQWIEQSYTSGFGYASAVWKLSRIIKYVTAFDPDVPIFTNGPDAVYVLAGRPAIMIPAKIDPRTRKMNDAYSDELATVAAELKAKHGMLLYFHTIPWRWYLPSEEELRKGMGLRLVASEEDGSVYQ